MPRYEGVSPVNQPPSATRGTRRRRLALRYPRAAAAIAAPLCLAISALVAPADAAVAQPAYHARPGSATRSAASSAATGSTITFPGLSASSYTVTLITGDQMRLASAGGGRYAVTAVPASGFSPAIAVHVHSRPGKPSSVQALPLAAEPLITSGQVDPGLFDVSYLAAHGDTGPKARIRLTLQYAGKSTAAALRTAAAALPSATVAATAPGRGEVTLTVAVARASAFWAALAGRPLGSPASLLTGGHLTGGVTRVWLTGHRTAAARPTAQDATPTVTITMTVTKKTGPLQGNDTTFTLSPMQLYGIQGSSAGKQYLVSPVCVDQNPCTTWRATFSVPMGIYYGFGFALWPAHASDAIPQIADVLAPQIDATGNTDVAIDLTTARHITVSTPRPTQPFGGFIGDNRALPDGESIFNPIVTNYGLAGDLWVATAAEDVTAGTFHFETAFDMGDPPITATVTTPSRLDLSPVYPRFETLGAPGGFTRFSGTHTVPVVDAADGQQADFAKIDARGKMVLLHLPTADTLEERDSRGEAQLTNALAAGAAGVLYDNSVLRWTPWWLGQQVPVHIPFAGIAPSEASALRSLLSQGPVTITVTDNGFTPYFYTLDFNNEGRVPSSLDYHVTSRQLATRHEIFSTSQQAVQQDSFAFRPDQNVAFNNSFDWLPGSSRITEYVGPTSPNLVWEINSAAGPVPPGEGFIDPVEVGLDYQVLGQRSDGTDGWFAEPAAPGAPEASFTQAQPGRFVTACANCREGDTFFPFVYDVSGASSSKTGDGFGWTVGSSDIHLYDASGNTIPPTSLSGAATYQLPPQQGRYKLVTQDAAGVSTTWDFTSAAPTADHTPPGTFCLPAIFVGSTDPCQADPLVYLRYNAVTDLSNSVTAPGTHRLQVTAYHQAPGGPPISALKLWISIDGGSTWQQLHTDRHGAGSYTAEYRVPAMSSTNGHISIMAQASDTRGDDITQIIRNAFSLTGSPTRAGR
jgi:hypothetical protein